MGSKVSPTGLVGRSGFSFVPGNVDGFEILDEGAAPGRSRSPFFSLAAGWLPQDGGFRVLRWLYTRVQKNLPIDFDEYLML